VTTNNCQVSTQQHITMTTSEPHLITTTPKDDLGVGVVVPPLKKYNHHSTTTTTQVEDSSSPDNSPCSSERSLPSDEDYHSELISDERKMRRERLQSLPPHNSEDVDIDEEEEEEDSSSTTNALLYTHRGGAGGDSIMMEEQKWTTEDDELEQQCQTSCSTLSEQLFFICTQPKDTGVRLLSKTLAQQLQQLQEQQEAEAIDAAKNSLQDKNGGEDIEKRVFDLNKFRDVSRNNASLMHVSARINNTGCLEVLHKYGGNIDAQDDLNATPLFYTCAHNCQESAVFLLSQGANPNHKDRYGGHPLSVCLRNDHLELMKILVLFNADIHAKGQRGNTCLHLACADGRLKKVRYLMEECKASLKRTNRDDEHVLYSALSSTAVTDFLCENSEAKVLTSMLSRVNSFGKSVFHVCCERGHLDSLLVIMRIMLKKADDRKQALEFLAMRLNEGDNVRGYTPLHLAIINDRVEVVKFLLSINDIAINNADSNGDTALHHAIRIGSKVICDYLIQYGASVRSKNSKGVACWEMAYDADIKLNTSEISALEYLWHRKNNLGFNKRKKKKAAAAAAAQKTATVALSSL